MIGELTVRAVRALKRLGSWNQVWQQAGQRWKPTPLTDQRLLSSRRASGCHMGLVGVNPEERELGMPLQVAFDDVTPEVTLAKFPQA